MNVIKSRFVYHLMAIITVAIWGTTFVSTKILIQHGLSPSDIFFYRFTLAYLCMWCISYKKLFANRVKDELLLLLAGLCGGTIYFITENTALGITLASNVSLIVCTSPVLTTLLSYLFRRKEPFTRHLVYGSIMALIGVGLVVFNGSFILKINPLGDILSLTAALMWAFYCLILKQLDNHYSIVLSEQCGLVHSCIQRLRLLGADFGNAGGSVLRDGRKREMQSDHQKCVDQCRHFLLLYRRFLYW